MILKTLGSTKSTAQLREGKVRIGGDGRVEHNGKCKLGGSEIAGAKADGVEVRDDKVRKKGLKTSKSKKTVGSSDFFTLGARLAFTKLRPVFVKALIFYHFDPKHLI